MAEPTYSFTIPSITDDTRLDCRIYHPNSLGATTSVRAAVIAHPYAPLGGSYDDAVVLSIVETLLQQDYIAFTFNFRGAGNSEGKTSWSGKPETEDYISLVGLAMHYAEQLSTLINQGTGSTEQSIPPSILLAGYSYGSLVLARLPFIDDIVKRFRAATIGTAAAEIILRARTLAKQNITSLDAKPQPLHNTPRGRFPATESDPSTTRSRDLLVVMGGEETDSSERRRSRDSRRSVDKVVRELPGRIKMHAKQLSDSDRKLHRQKDRHGESAMREKARSSSSPALNVKYLLISPVILPFSSTICPPSFVPTSRAGPAYGSAGSQFLRHPTLAVFGTRDSFTSSKRFRTWAEKQSTLSSSFLWQSVDGAGHFWSEKGVMQVLQERITRFVSKEVVVE
ncbi:hypothetical protein LTR62_003251 [Meristemomyces frigidus]|uniref:AB hydrolase-1 domain-containing protein n=1 Tax=Meristemomyces frigidus TaxID=1508187 RepID=A0AAN7TS34_9PEZI|nr:hypothetical protein LTR62_003251 [Meristemomyces frigidus]